MLHEKRRNACVIGCWHMLLPFTLQVWREKMEVTGPAFCEGKEKMFLAD